MVKVSDAHPSGFYDNGWARVWCLVHAATLACHNPALPQLNAPTSLSSASDTELSLFWAPLCGQFRHMAPKTTRKPTGKVHIAAHPKRHTYLTRIGSKNRAWRPGVASAFGSALGPTLQTEEKSEDDESRSPLPLNLILEFESTGSFPVVERLS
jgi:hypothetical protein